MAMGQGASGALPIFALYMQQVYKDAKLGYSEDAVFDLPPGFDPCPLSGESLGESGAENDIDEIYE